MPVYNEYHLNKSLINPAIIGSEGCTWIKGTDMHQWVGMKGAPQIQTLSIESSLQKRSGNRVSDSKVHGLGVFLYRDVNGAYRTMGGQVSYAYHFYLNKGTGLKLGMGISFRMFMASLNESAFKSEEPDPLMTGGVSTHIKPDAGAGIFLYSGKFYAGLSSGQLMNASYAIGSDRHYYIIAGYFTGSKKDRYRWLPSMAFKTNEHLDKQLDLNIKMLMDDSWWLGLGYRHNMDKLPGAPVLFVPMIGFNFGNITAMYALDITPSRIQKYNYGTHELMISWRFCKDTYRCPVYR